MDNPLLKRPGPDTAVGAPTENGLLKRPGPDPAVGAPTENDLLKRPGPDPAVAAARDNVPEPDAGNGVPDPRQRPARGPAASRRLRRWSFAAVLALLSYWPAAYVFLNTPLGEWVVNGGWSGRPRKVLLHWQAGTSWWPGRLVLTGLKLDGQSRRMEWSLEAETARGRLSFFQLFRRKVELREVVGDGARFTIRRREAESAEPPPRPRRWSVELPEIEIRRISELILGDWKLESEAEAVGGFFYRAGEVRLAPSRFDLRAGRLESRGRKVARGLALSGQAELAPYVPREFPGPLGLDFLSGNLKADGVAGPAADPFTAALLVEQGRLRPGSRLDYRSSQGAARLDYTAVVNTFADGDRLALAIDATDLVIGPRADAPPLLTSGQLEVRAESRDTRLSGLLGRTVGLGASSASPLVGALQARDLCLHLAGERLAAELIVKQASGELDLGAFLHRELAVAGLKGQGGEVRVSTQPARTAAEPPPRPWALSFPNAHLEGLEAVSYDQLKVSGPLALGASFGFVPTGNIEVDEVHLKLPGGSLMEGEEILGRRIKLELSARAEPLAANNLEPTAVLAALSGRLSAEAEVTSLAFLRHWLGKHPWWDLEGRGRLAAELELERGALSPGSRLDITATTIEEHLLGALAKGRGTIAARVTEATPPRLELLARLDRFVVEDEVRTRLLEGSGLSVKVSSGEAVRLDTTPSDLVAVADLEHASLTNLAMFNPLLPSAAEVELLPGPGLLDLHLELDGKQQKAHGRVSLAAENAGVRVQELAIAGRLVVEAPLLADSLAAPNFDLAGARLTLTEGSYREVGGRDVETGWWARLLLPRARLVLGKPLSFESSLDVEMKDSGPFLALFAQKRRYLNWFSEVLLVEGVKAQAELKLGPKGLEVEPLEVAAEKLALVGKLRFGEGVKEGDLFLSYGKLEVGVELRDGKRDLKILNPRKWFETWHRP